MTTTSIPTPAPTPTGVLHLRTWLPAELDEPFSRWCDDHHAEQLEVPGFLRVRRFSLVESTATEPADYLTLYDLERLDVLDGPDFAAYRAKGNAVPELLAGRLRAARTAAELVAAAPAIDGLVPAGAGLAHLFVADGPDLALWFADHAPGLVDALTDLGATGARLLAADDGTQVVVVDLAREPGEPGDLEGATTLDALPRPPAAGSPTGWGLYRLDHVDQPGGEAVSPHRARRDRP